MMSPIASAPFFTFNFSRFQEAFLRVYLYFILERIIFTFKVPLVTEIFYYQRLCEERAHFYLAISHQTKIITISNTPTMTKNDGTAAAAVQSSAPLPPRINANTPPGHDTAILPSASLRTRPSACLFPTARFRGRRADQRATSCFGCLPRSCTRRHSSLRSISIVLSCGDDGKVSNLFLRRRISIETHLLIFLGSAAAVTSADLQFLEIRTPRHSSSRSILMVSICNEGEKVSTLIVFLRISPETHQLF